MSRPGAFQNMSRKNGAFRDIQRMRAMERAAELLGTHAKLAAALSIDPRLLRAKISAERPIHDQDLAGAAAALRAHSAALTDLAFKIDSITEASA